MITFEEAELLAKKRALDGVKKCGDTELLNGTDGLREGELLKKEGTIITFGYGGEFDCGWRFNSLRITDGKKSRGGNPIFIDRFDGQVSPILRFTDFNRPKATSERLIWVEVYKKLKYPNGLPPKGNVNPNFEHVSWNDFKTIKKKPWWKIW